MPINTNKLLGMSDYQSGLLPAFPATDLVKSLELAIGFVDKYHAKQKDRAGKPYKLHLIAVKSLVEKMLKTELNKWKDIGTPPSTFLNEAKIVALLHDILEDTDIPIALLKEHFSCRIVDAIQTITKRENEDYQNYLTRVKENPLARVVKIADLTHNSDLSRLKKVTEKDLIRTQKYLSAMLYLKGEQLH